MHEVQQLQREDESALALYRSLRRLGAQPGPGVLTLAARAGHTEVVREVLASGVECLPLKKALLAALRNAADLQRTRELVHLLEGAGAVASYAEKQFELIQNKNGNMAGALLREFGLLIGRNSLLQAALYAANVGLSNDLLNEGAQPSRGCLVAACKSGDDNLFERVLGMGTVPAEDREALALIIKLDRVMMLRLLLDAAQWHTADPVLLDALESACRLGSAECTEELLQAGVDASLTQVLQGAVSSDRLDMVRRLLATGLYRAGHSPLNAALEEAFALGRSACAEQLLQAGADPAATTALQAAARLDNVGLVRRLLATGRYDPGERALNEALEEACRLNSMECIKVLLEAGSNPADTKALELAACKDSLDLIQLLLGTGRYPAGCSSYMPKARLSSALHASCRHGHLEATKLLLGAGAKPVLALSEAAKARHVDVVKLLLGTFMSSSGGGVFGPDELSTALTHACRNGDLAVASELLRAGADRGFALRLLAQESRTAFLRALLDWDPCMREPGLLRGALQTACRYCCIYSIQELLNAGADPAAGLYDASRKGCAAAVRLLLDTGRCPPEGEEMQSALVEACVWQWADVINMLLNAGVQPLGALTAAAFSGQLSVVRRLIQAAGRCHPEDPRVTPAFPIACRWGCSQTIKALLDAGVDPWAGLPEAANSRRLELTRMLLAARREDAAAMPKAPDQALWLACYRQDLDIVCALLAAGADPALALSCPAVRTNQELRDALLASGRCPPELLAASMAQTDGDAAATAQTACGTAAAGTFASGTADPPELLAPTVAGAGVAAKLVANFATAARMVQVIRSLAEMPRRYGYYGFDDEEGHVDYCYVVLQGESVRVPLQRSAMLVHEAQNWKSPHGRALATGTAYPDRPESLLC